MMNCSICNSPIPSPGIICEDCYVESLEKEIKRLRVELMESLIKRVEAVDAAEDGSLRWYGPKIPGRKA